MRRALKPLVLGGVLGGLLAVATVQVLSRYTHRAVYPPGTWVDRAARTTLPGRRAYTLPLNNPDTVPAGEADHMKPDDLVIGVLVAGHARAYPWWIIANYHVVNDTVGDAPVYVALCELCSGAAAFSPIVAELPRRPLTFQITGAASGTFQVSDIQTLSQWHPFSGECVAGSLRGRRLKRIVSVMTRWDKWKKLHPSTEVVYASSRMRTRKHGARPAEMGHPNRFQYDVNLDDKRLPTNELVFGVVGTEAGTGLAFPLRALRGKSHVEVTYQGRPLLILLREDYQVTAFLRQVGDTVLSFEPLPHDASKLRDQAGTVWDQWGRAVAGPSQGEELEAARGYLTEWYEWVSGFPQTRIYSAD